MASYENAGGPILGNGRFILQDVTMVATVTKGGNISCLYPFVAQVAEVEGNFKSGGVKILFLTPAHDLGKIIYHLMVEGQVHGTIVQGIGFALYEDMSMENGMITNSNLKQHIVP